MSSTILDVAINKADRTSPHTAYTLEALTSALNFNRTLPEHGVVTETQTFRLTKSNACIRYHGYDG